MKEIVAEPRKNYDVIGDKADLYILLNPSLALTLFEFKDRTEDFLDRLNTGGRKILRKRGYTPGNCYSFRGNGKLLDAIHAPKCEFGLVMVPSRLGNFAHETKFRKRYLDNFQNCLKDIESRRLDYQSFKIFFERIPEACYEQILFYCAYGLDAKDPDLRNHRELLTNLYDFWVESSIKHLDISRKLI